MTYTPHKPPIAETPEQLRARIPGWGVDSDPADRPTAKTLLRAPFCFADNRYNFLDTELYAKIRGAF